MGRCQALVRQDWKYLDASLEEKLFTEKPYLQHRVLLLDPRCCQRPDTPNFLIWIKARKAIG